MLAVSEEAFSGCEKAVGSNGKYNRREAPHHFAFRTSHSALFGGTQECVPYTMNGTAINRRRCAGFSRSKNRVATIVCFVGQAFMLAVSEEAFSGCEKTVDSNGK